MCAPVIPLISAIGGLATAASSLGILGGNRNRVSQPARAMTPPPTVQGPGPAASAAGDDEKLRRLMSQSRSNKTQNKKEISRQLRKDSHLLERHRQLIQV